MHAKSNYTAPTVAQAITGASSLPCPTTTPATYPAFAPQPVTGASFPTSAPVAWLTAAALASAGLPGLLTSPFRIRERVRQERWIARRRGGGRQYAVASIRRRCSSCWHYARRRTACCDYYLTRHLQYRRLNSGARLQKHGSLAALTGRFIHARGRHIRRSPSRCIIPIVGRARIA
jgi:hypothetical protein